MNPLLSSTRILCSTLLLMALLSFALFTTGCLGGGSSDEKVEDPHEEKAEFKLLSVERRLVVGKKSQIRTVSGGQFLLAKIAIKNITDKDQEFGPEMFVIRKETLESDEPYEQTYETGLSVAYNMAHGMGSAERDLLYPETGIHPNFTAKKIVSFSIPEEDDITEWSVRYVPQDVIMSIGDEDVEIIDNRALSLEEAKNKRKRHR